MKIDILSDTHFDSHFGYINPSDELFCRFWDKLSPAGDVLIIAGDIGHHNIQNANILMLLFKHYYKNIVLVLGNHDFYVDKNRIYQLHDGKLQHLYSNSLERVAEFKQLCEEVDGVHLLDGDVVEIDGVNFGGAMGWYDGKYCHEHKAIMNFGRDNYNKKVNLQTLWKSSLNDARYIKPEMKYDGFLQEETEKIERVLAQKPDVMITHLNPSVKTEHQNRPYVRDLATSFFCYDGKKHMEMFEGKYWVFGHSHFNGEFDIDERFTLLANCLGYSSENTTKMNLKTIELQP